MCDWWKEVNVAQQTQGMNEPRSNSKYFDLSKSLFNMEVKTLVERWTKWLDDCGYQEVIPVTLMATMSVGTALAVCLIFSSGVGRGPTLFHTTCPSTSDPSPPSPSGVWGLMESWDLSSSADEAVDWTRKRNNGLTSRKDMKWSKRTEKVMEREQRKEGRTRTGDRTEGRER